MEEVNMKKLLAVVLILAGYAIGQAARTPSAPKPSGTEHPGRYQIFFSPHARADAYLVDTETGKIWRPVTITNAKDTNLKGAAPEIWLYQERVDNEQEFDTWSAFHNPPAAPAPQ